MRRLRRGCPLARPARLNTREQAPKPSLARPPAFAYALGRTPNSLSAQRDSGVQRKSTLAWGLDRVFGKDRQAAQIGAFRRLAREVEAQCGPELAGVRG